MEGEEGEGLRLSKRIAGGEVNYKTKLGINVANGSPSKPTQTTIVALRRSLASMPRSKNSSARPLSSSRKRKKRMETGVAGRAKPFGIELCNVKCLRCGNYGHQSGDRKCPLQDAIMPNEENRLKRDDHLTAILAHTDPTQWELKQKPGISHPHGGFKIDDPNQQIVVEDIFDEYGGLGSNFQTTEVGLSI